MARSPRIPAGSDKASPLPESPARHSPFLLGHPRARTALGGALASGAVHHAWILHGPPGVGKMLAAEAFARLSLDPEATPAQMRALEPPSGTAVDRMINSGTHADFHVIRKELAALSENRELRERKQLNIPLDLLRERMLGDSAVFRTATHGHGKAFIIDEAELLDADAQNAMLKTLEEPPARTLILLVTAREDRLLPTIRSRCQRVAFGPLDAAAMRAWWERSGLQVPAADRACVEEFADGAPGMAQRAAAHGIASWRSELWPMLDALDSGAFPGGLSERLAELVDELATSVVDRDSNASKDAANRLGMRLLARLLGMRVKQTLKAAGENARALQRALALQQSVEDMEQHIRNNVNMKHALGNMVAQWAEQGAAEGAAA